MSAVIVSLRVRATPDEAFDVFTQEIGAWWRPNDLFQITPRGDGALSFDGETRLITTLPSGKVFEIGRVSVWKRGEQLSFSWRQASFAPDQATHVDVRATEYVVGGHPIDTLRSELGHQRDRKPLLDQRGGEWRLGS